MNFDIRFGVPEMLDFWNSIYKKKINNSFSKDEMLFYNKFVKCLKLLSINPRHPGLKSHEISQLTDRYGMKVFESYLENNTPGAERIFWVYGPDKQSITIIGIEPHPNDKSDAYRKIKLSSISSKRN